MRVLSACYTALIYILTPFVVLRFYLKSIKQPIYRRRIGERLGLYHKNHEPVDYWVHAVSFGEVEVAAPLVNLMLSDGHRVCITTTTPSGSQRVLERFGGRVQHVYLPFELPYAISRFLKQFKPTIGVIMETEIWPNLYREMYRRKVKCVIANARLSPRSLKGYEKIKAVLKPILQNVSVICAQTAEDKARFCALGAEPSKTEVMGNIKFDMTEDPSQVAQGQAYKLKLEERLVWIAASTHPGEEAMILKAFQVLKTSLPSCLLILAPRHPDRSSEVMKLISEAKLTVDKRSECQTPEAVNDVYLIDTLGELRMFYYLADMAFVGGSLVEHGGHNVLEAVIANVPVIVGPHMFNFQEMYEKLVDAEGILTVKDENALVNTLLSLNLHKTQRDVLNRAAMSVLQENKGALDKHYQALNSI